jgi:sulfur carrier protein ThiS
MPHIAFAPAIQRHIVCPERTVAGDTVLAALEAVFGEQPELRGYLLDDQGQLRRHVAVFVDGVGIRDRKRLSDAVEAGSRIYVVQAISGG